PDGPRTDWLPRSSSRGEPGPAELRATFGRAEDVLPLPPPGRARRSGGGGTAQLAGLVGADPARTVAGGGRETAGRPGGARPLLLARSRPLGNALRHRQPSVGGRHAAVERL